MDIFCKERKYFEGIVEENEENKKLLDVHEWKESEEKETVDIKGKKLWEIQMKRKEKN